MAGRGNRRTSSRLVPGATVRMGFRRANGAKTGADRKDDRLAILSRCERDDVWLKTSITSNHRTEPSAPQHVREISAWRFAMHLPRDGQAW
jgi:hypothetical protein